MTLLFKITGFILVISTSAFIGFLKSGELFLRYKKLNKIQKNIADLKQRIRLHGGEINNLILLSFEEFPLDYLHLQKCDIEILNDFFANIGMGDTKSEYERCELYINLLKAKADEAKSKYQELGRLYKTIGLFSGIFICIFFI